MSFLITALSNGCPVEMIASAVIWTQIDSEERAMVFYHGATSFASCRLQCC